jgi:hypothetical protein
MKSFNNMNALRSTLKSRGLSTIFRASMGSRVDFLNGAADNATILSVLHHIPLSSAAVGPPRRTGPTSACRRH